MADRERSEDVYGAKLDRCLYNSMMKFVGGMGVGIVFSALFFRRKPWPVILGGGVGIGMGIASCNYEFRYGVALPVKSPIDVARLTSKEQSSNPLEPKTKPVHGSLLHRSILSPPPRES